MYSLKAFKNVCLCATSTRLIHFFARLLRTKTVAIQPQKISYWLNEQTILSNLLSKYGRHLLLRAGFYYRLVIVWSSHQTNYQFEKTV